MKHRTPLSLMFPLLMATMASGQVQEITVERIAPLAVRESSGLAFVDGTLWTHNDETDVNLYQMDTTGRIIDIVPISRTRNLDWEDLAYVGGKLLIGDIGKHRTDTATRHVHILGYDEVKSGGRRVDRTLTFRLDQNPLRDCEAMVLVNGQMYFFTKNWPEDGSNDTTTYVHSLSMVGSTRVAPRRGTLHVAGLVTGASYDEVTDRLALLVSELDTFRTFIYIIRDFSKDDWKLGSPLLLKRADGELLKAQAEGIAWDGRGGLYLTNERCGSDRVNEPSPFLWYLPPQ